jgi:deoxyribonuclease-4
LKFFFAKVSSTHSSQKMSTLRVRQVLENMDTVSKANLRKLLPGKLPVPDVETHRYPSALLSALPEGESYGLLGFIAEHLLRLPSGEIHLEALIKATHELLPTWSAEAEGKVRKSKTTQPFLDCLVATRKEMEKVLRTGEAEGPLKFEEVVTNGSVEGHPDIYNKTQVFEVKLTGMLKQNWTSFILQVFSYGALMPDVTDLYLVLPLQQTVWHADICGWGKRAGFLEAITKWSSHEQTAGVEMAMKAALLYSLYNIGFHAGKQKQLLNTVASLGDYRKPYQIFLSGPQNSHIKADDSDIAATLGFIGKVKAQIYVHSQYIINLCAKTDDNWHTNLLIRNLQITRAFGGKGVVVHVGKSVKQPLAEALEAMRSSIQTAIEHATVDCPLLLETPAGQGTETLTDMKDFLDFVESFKDSRLRMCLDTCHVYACGVQPLDYIQAALQRPGLLKLIHFNDSHGGCGSCVDRHAPTGTGKIGFKAMALIADTCAKADLPMLVE